MKKLSRAEAKAAGLKRYFSGNPCKRGHICERLVSSSACVKCKSLNEKGRYRPPTKESREKALARYYKRTEGKVYRPTKDERERKRKDYLAKYMREKRSSDKLFCAKDRIRRRVNKALSEKGFKREHSMEEILGCSLPEFIDHIESQFLKGMSWDNRQDWHIDHIVPISMAKTEKDVIDLNHFTNLRPIWASDNFRKSNKMEYLI